MEASSLDEAKDDFKDKFHSKTGLDWENRTDTPKDKKYTFIEKSYDDDEEDGDDDDDNDAGERGPGDVKSELDVATQRLMELIFKYEHSGSQYRQTSMLITSTARTTSIPC